LRGRPILMLAVLLTAVSLASPRATVIGKDKPAVFLAGDRIHFLLAVPAAVKLGAPLLIESHPAEEAFLKYFSGQQVEVYGDYLNASLALASRFFSGIGKAVLAPSSNITALTLGSIYAAVEGAPLIAVETLDKNLKARLESLGFKKLFAVGVPTSDGVLAKGVKSSDIIRYVNKMAQRPYLLAIGFKNDGMLPILAAYVGAKKCRVLLLDNVRVDNRLTGFLREMKPSKIALVAAFETLKEGGEKGLVAAFKKAVMKASGKRYLTASIGVLSAVDLASATAFLARNLFYDRLRGEWQGRLIAIYMDNAEALGEKITRIGALASLEREKLVLKEGGKGSYDEVSSILERGGVLTYINLHGNPLGMAPAQQGAFLLTGIGGPRPVPYIPPSIIITFSCKTMDFTESYMERAEDSIALSFISRGAVAYIGATELEYTVGIEGGTAYAELITTMVLSGEELGEIARVVDNLRMGFSEGEDRYRKAYTVLLGDPELSLKRAISMNGFRVVEESDRSFRIEMLKVMPVVYGKITVNHPVSSVDSIEVTGINIAGAAFIEESGQGKSTVFFYATKELTKDVGDLKPGNHFRVRLKLKTPYQLIYAVTGLLAIIIALIVVFKRMKKARRSVNPGQPGICHVACPAP